MFDLGDFFRNIMVVYNETCLYGFFLFCGERGQSVHMTNKNTLVLQSCTDAPRVEHGLYSETSEWSSDDSN